MPSLDISHTGYQLALVRADGEVFVQGQEAHGLCRPPAGPFVKVVAGDYIGLAIRPDGSIAGWGKNLNHVAPFPSPPSGVVYTDAAVGYYHALLLRSDGQVDALSLNNFYGVANVPALPPGIVFTKVVAGAYHNLALLSDGSVVGWGDNLYGQLNIPALPAGVTYTDISTNVSISLAVRSDGQIVTWGANMLPLIQPPALPSGTAYVMGSAGSAHCVAWRSDGVLVAWGSNTLGATDVPLAPPGLHAVEVEAGSGTTVVRWSDGSLAGWGGDPYYHHSCPLPWGAAGSATVGARFSAIDIGIYHTLVVRADGTVEGFGDERMDVTTIPPLPPGVTYVDVGAGNLFSLALRSDGTLIGWGANDGGQSTVPPLPPGVTYVAFEESSNHVLALRSDGEVVAFGWNISGQTNVPPLPAGMSYVEVDAYYQHSLFLRSDGTLLHSGSTVGPLAYAPVMPSTAPAGLEFVDIATGQYIAGAVLSDGSAEVWSANGYAAPALPWGVSYVEIDCGGSIGWLRRSDGEVVPFGSTVLVGAHPEYDTPPLLPGTSYLDIDATHQVVVTRVGPTCTYVSTHPGCAGSLPSPRLVPRDTPRIGRSFELRLFDLPNDVAMLGMGLQPSAPQDLAALGMPGCDLAISVDAVQVLAGQNRQARWTLPIPDVPALVGLRFYNQALVLDLSAGNAFGAVLSDAAEGVVGYR